MSQHDYAIADGSGATVRADLNSALDAIATNNAGATAPSTTFANQWWFDTANDLLKIRSEDNTTWISFARKEGSNWYPVKGVVQRVHTSTGAVATGTTTMPIDDTIPQNTEGTEFLSLAITPTKSTNRLRIHVTINVAHSTAAVTMMAALFQDSTANALCVGSTLAGTTYGLTQIKLLYEMDAGTTSSTTFKVRVGTGTAGTVTINGTGGARLFGGVLLSVMTIEEIAV